MKNKYIWLLFIIILASVLRLWQLGNVPASPDWDEAALGYNAYSLLHTGKDEFGKFLPVVLRSFDDYKPALYAYLAIPSVFIFGLNVFAVRLPSAIFGILSVLAVYFLLKELFINHKYKEYISLLGSFFLAISPWSIQFSRVAFESNVGTALNIFAALFFLKSFKKPKYLFISVFFAALSIYTYQSEKVFTPLLVLALVLIYRQELFKLNKKIIFFKILLGLVLISPMVFFILGNNSSLLRATGTSIFSNNKQLLTYDIRKLERDITNNDKLGFIFDNRRVIYAQAILGGYLSHFDLNWLFIQGDGTQRHHAPGMGILYLFELPLILIGIYQLLFSEINKKTKLIIIVWFLLAPVPASITTGVPHAVRTLNFLPTWQIFSALGLITLFITIQKIRFWKVIFILCVIFAGFNFSYYLNQYFVQQNYFNSSDWQFGYQETVSQIAKLEPKAKHVVVSNSLIMDQSYIFFLFYLKYPPEEYQKSINNDSGRLMAYHAFGKYIFRPINWEKDSTVGDTLYVGSSKEIPDSMEIIKKIYDLSGNEVMRIIKI